MIRMALQVKLPVPYNTSSFPLILNNLGACAGTHPVNKLYTGSER